MHDDNRVHPQRFDIVFLAPGVDKLSWTEQRQLDLQSGLAFRNFDGNLWREIVLAAGIEAIPQFSLDYSKQHYGDSSKPNGTQRTTSNRPAA